MATGLFDRYLGIGIETVYGTAVAPTHWYDFAGEGIEQKRDINFLSGSRIISNNRTFQGHTFVQGSADIFLPFRDSFYLCRAMIGEPLTALPSGDVEYHIFTPTVNENPASLTLDIYREGYNFRHTGGIITGARMGITGPEHFGMAFNWLAKDSERVGTSNLDNDAIQQPIYTLDKNAATPFTILFNNTSMGDWNAYSTGLDLEFSWDRDLRFASRIVTPVGFVTKGQVKVKGRFKWFLTSDTTPLLNAWEDQEDTSMLVTFTGDEIASSGYDSQLIFTFPRIRFTGRTPTIRNPGYRNTEVDMSFEALLDEDEGYPFQVELYCEA